MRPVRHGGDIPINVRSMVSDHWEHPDHAAYYEGIYLLTLNCDVHVMFIPYIDKTKEAWPPIVPKGEDVEIDEPGSFENARRWELMLAQYAVTPSLEQSGQSERLVSEGLVTQVFYVHPDLFKQLTEELSFIAEERSPGVWGAIRISSLGDTPLVHFVKDFANSDCLSPYDKEILASTYRPYGT